jgi:hypothetical protein
VLNTSLYAWTYRVAEWAWEAELAETIAAAAVGLDTTAASEPSMLADGSPSLGLVTSLAKAVGSLGEKPGSEPPTASYGLPSPRLVASFAQALAADASVDADSAAPLHAQDGPALSGLESGMTESSSPRSAAPLPSPAIAPVPVVQPTTDSPEPVHVENDSVNQSKDASSDADRAAARGRWVLKGYHTRYAYTLVPDPIKEDNRYAAQEQSDYGKQNKLRGRAASMQWRRDGEGGEAQAIE